MCLVLSFGVLVFLLAGCAGTKILMIPERNSILEQKDINESLSSLAGKWAGEYKKHKIDMSIKYVKDNNFYINVNVYEDNKPKPFIPMRAEIYNINGNKYAFCFPFVKEIVKHGNYHYWGSAFLFPFIIVMKINEYDNNKFSVQEVRIAENPKLIYKAISKKEKYCTTIGIHQKDLMECFKKNNFTLSPEVMLTRKKIK